MPYEPMIRSFSSLEEASAARDAVVAAGVDKDRLELRVLQDEAGPVEGNFYVGNGRTRYGGEADAVKGGPDVPYEDNFRETVYRGSCLLIIAAVDEQARQTVARALEPFDAVAPGDPAGGA